MLEFMHCFVRAYSAPGAPVQQQESCLETDHGSSAEPCQVRSQPRAWDWLEAPAHGQALVSDWQEPPAGPSHMNPHGGMGNAVGTELHNCGTSFGSLQSLGSRGSSFHSQSSVEDGFSLYRLLDVDPELRVAYLS